MTYTQRLMRPILNFLVERFFPNHAFFGNDYLTAFKSHPDLAIKWGSTDMAVAMFLVSRLRKQGATKGTFEATEVTDNGTPVGSWRLTLEKLEETGQ